MIFLVLFALGRWLKRRKGVKLGVLYVLFCGAIAIWLPYVFGGMQMPWRDGGNWVEQFIGGVGLADPEAILKAPDIDQGGRAVVRLQ